MWMTFIIMIWSGIAGPNTITITKYENSAYVVTTESSVTYNFE